MSTDYFWLFILMLVNFCDVLIYYLLSYKFFDYQPPFPKKAIAAGITYGVIIGTLSYYIGDSNLFQIIITIFLILMFIHLHKEKNALKLFEIIVLYVLSFVILTFTRMPQTTILLSININLDRSIHFLLIIMVQMIIISELLSKNWLTRLYKRVARDIFLQIAMIAIAFVLLCLILAFNLEISTTYFISLAMLLFFTVVAFYQLIPMIYFHTRDLPRLLHDRNTELMAHHARIHTETECTKAKASVNLFMEKADMNPKADEYIVGKYKENMSAFINKKIEYHETIMKFERYINYSEPHKTVQYDEILYIIGILMDNAIEYGRTKFPTFVTVSCIYGHLLIEQSNAVLSSITSEKIEKMVEAGVSSKDKYGRGYGLYNLKEMIKSHGGKLEITSSYDAEYESNYLNFKITISAYAH